MRQGPYRGVGAVAYGMKLWNQGASDGISPGILAIADLGQMLSPRWGLGVHFEAGSSFTGNSRTTEAMGIGLQLNPLRNLSVHAVVGLGINTFSQSADRETPTRYGYGSLYELSASWDIFLTRRTSGGFSLAPTVIVRYMPNDKVSSLQVCAGIQLVVWSGLKRAELILPEAESYLGRRSPTSSRASNEEPPSPAPGTQR